MPTFKSRTGFLLLAILFAPALFAAERGTILGGAPHAAPDWFKESFLEIADDVDEASEEGRHVMLFFQLNACPYCDRMLTESFESDPNMSYIQEHFDVIAINVKGDREIAFNDEVSVLEKELAEMLQVRATPAILFLNADNQQVVRVNGYRAPDRFSHVLSYVSSKSYETTKLADYLDANLKRDVYTLRPSSLFSKVSDLSAVKGPLAVIFEDSTCLDCPEFHDRMLSRQDVMEELGKFTVVRLDTDSTETIVDVDGEQLPPAALSRKYAMTYRPGVLVFDGGELIRRSDSLLYSFHFREGLRFVADGYHKRMTYREYSEARREELLAAGVDINLAD